jgi:hypothetical protein
LPLCTTSTGAFAVALVAAPLRLGALRFTSSSTTNSTSSHSSGRSGHLCRAKRLLILLGRPVKEGDVPRSVGAAGRLAAQAPARATGELKQFLAELDLALVLDRQEPARETNTNTESATHDSHEGSSSSRG